MSDGFQDPPDPAADPNVADPALEKKRWPAFLLNLALRIAFLGLAGMLIPVTLGMWLLRDKGVPMWEILMIGGSSGVSTALFSISIMFVRKGRFDKHDMNVAVSLSADALMSNYTINSQYTYQQLGPQ